MLQAQKYQNMIPDQLRKHLERISPFKNGDDPAFTILIGQSEYDFHDPGKDFGRKTDAGHVIFGMSVETSRDKDHVGHEFFESRNEFVRYLALVLIIPLTGQYSRM